jgi:hypothetical protein
MKTDRIRKILKNPVEFCKRQNFIARLAFSHAFSTNDGVNM